MKKRLNLRDNHKGNGISLYKSNIFVFGGDYSKSNDSIFFVFHFHLFKVKKIYNHFWQSARISKRSLGYIFSFNVYFHAIFSLRHLNVVMWKSFFDGFFFANPFCRSKTRVVEKNNCQSLLTKLSHSNLDHNC